MQAEYSEIGQPDRIVRNSPRITGAQNDAVRKESEVRSAMRRISQLICEVGGITEQLEKNAGPVIRGSCDKHPNAVEDRPNIDPPLANDLAGMADHLQGVRDHLADVVARIAI